MMDNTHEDAARWRKVAKLLAALYKHDISPHRVRYLGKNQWATVAAAAGTKPPSTKTVELLRVVLRKALPPQPQLPAVPYP